MNQTHSPPPHPWAKGTHETYAMVSLVVDICTDSSGGLFSTHRLQDRLDYETIATWPGGGLEQVAHALLQEAARREAILGLLLMLSKDPTLLESLKVSDDKRQAVVASLSQSLRDQISATVVRLSEAVAMEALQAALSG